MSDRLSFHPRAVAACLSLLGLLLAAACDDRNRPLQGPVIDSVSPEPLSPGGRALVIGRAFGEAHSSAVVAIGGRLTFIESRTPESISIIVPDDQPAGVTFLALTTPGGVSEPFRVTVSGSQRPPDFEAPDVLRPDQRPHDGGPAADASRPDLSFSDLRLPDATLDTASGEFIADGTSRGVVLRLTPVDAPSGEVRVKVSIDESLVGLVWGAAFQVKFDAHQLRLVETLPQHDGQDVFVDRPAPDRVVSGLVTPPRASELMTLRFAIIGAGESRLDLLRQGTSLRDPANRALLDLVVTGGTIRTRTEGPR